MNCVKAMKYVSKLHRIQKWRHMVEAASTYSDLHMLLSVLDNCIKWERSLDNIVSYLTF